MRKTGIFAVIAGLALAMTASVSFLSFAKEERTPVDTIELSFYSDIKAGEAGGKVDVTLNSGQCSVSSVDIVNEKEYWLGGDKPKVEVWLSADRGYYFKKSGKSAFHFSENGDKVNYVSSSSKNDKEELKLTVTLEKLDKEDADLSVSGLAWDEDRGIANWDYQDIAQYYRVRLCHRNTGSGNGEEGIGPVYTVKENSFDFSGEISKTGSYYFKVKAVDARNNSGSWDESPYMDIDEEDIIRFSGQWIQNSKGWWFRNPDGSYTKNGWQCIRSKWYFFDEAGYMKTGWIPWGGKLYYCGDNGSMLVSTITPDGFTVGADGARIN